MFLNMIMFIKEKIINNNMGTAKQIDIKNTTYYFYNDMIHIKKLDSDLLKIDKKSKKDIGIYKIWFLIQQMKIKSYLKNTMMFLMELEAKSKK